MVQPLSIGDSDIRQLFKSLIPLENGIERVELEGRSINDPVVYIEHEKDTSPMFIHQDLCSSSTPTEFQGWENKKQSEVCNELCMINCVYMIRHIERHVTPLIELNSKRFIGVAITWKVHTVKEARYLVQKYNTGYDIEEHYILDTHTDKTTILKEIQRYLETRTKSFLIEYAKSLVAVSTNWNSNSDIKLAQTEKLMDFAPYVRLETANGYHLENNYVLYEPNPGCHLLYDNKLNFPAPSNSAVLFTELIDGEVRFLVSHNLPITPNAFNWVTYQHRLTITNGNVQRYLIADAKGNEVDVSNTIVSERSRSYVNIYHSTDLLAEFEKAKG